MRRGRVSIGLEISGREAHLALLERAPGARPRLLAAKSFSLAAPKDDAESISRAIRDVGGAGNDCFLAWLPDGEPITHQLVTAPAMRASEQLGYLKRLSDKEAGAAAGSDLHWQLQPLGSARIGDHPGVELLAVRLGREPTIEELSQETGLPIEQVEEVRHQRAALVSLDQQIGEDGDTALGDLLPSDAEAPEETAWDNERERIVHRAIESLPETERTVLTLRFGTGREEPQTLTAIGKRLGFSAERASQLEQRALKKLAESPELAALREAA